MLAPTMPDPTSLLAYFERIALAPVQEPTLSNLQLIVAAHIEAIPFENLDVLLGKGIELEPEALWHKLITDRRGGYCFEQNALLLHVLRQLGYEVTPLSARVVWQKPPEQISTRTHLFLRVELEGESWLADVGVGGISPTAAIRLSLNEQQETPQEPRRIISQGTWDGELRSPDAKLVHQVLINNNWQSVYEFTLEEMHPIDREVANWFTSAHPQSHFRNRLIAARSCQGGRLTLVDRELTRRAADGQVEVLTIESHSQLLSVLQESFGLTFPEGSQFSTPGLDW